MPVTTKRVVFIAENMITSFNYASISKKVLKDIGKAMRASRRMPKNANLSAKDIGGFLINNIHNSSAALADKEVIRDYVAAFRDMYEEKLGLTAAVVIVYVGVVDNEVFGIALAWDIDPEKYDDLYKQDSKQLYMTAVENFVVMLHR